MADYDIGAAFEAIEDELIASMIRNMDRHRAWENNEGIQWSMWQAEQLKALEKYKKANQKRYGKQFKEINDQISEVLYRARKDGNMQQEIRILNAIKNGFTGANKVTQGAAAEFFRLNDRKLEALIKATTNDMERAETAVLRKANDEYRKAIYNAQVYANTGAGTYDKAVDMATKDMLSRGLACVEYANGARHTLADYADMAIRTASKRAYLTGEGEKRQEWGIATVIVNKRGNPCPKCLPFCGKVLIDDVWSGGKKSDGPYPLMSKAIAAGLHHPRCKDSHTTYFPGISTADETWTKKELEAIGEVNRQEAQKQYAERQAEKFGRLAEYSLDDENKKVYANREKEWREQSKKGRIPGTEMNRKVVESAKYKRRIEKLPESEDITKTVWQEMVEAIQHRDNSEFEDLIFIDSKSGAVKKSIEFEKVRTAKPTKAMYKMLEESEKGSIIAIHNHPSSTVPSWDDIVVASKRRYKYGLIACHDGSILKYEIEREPMEVFYSAAVAKLDKAGYNEDSLREFCEAVKDAGVRMEVL